MQLSQIRPDVLNLTDIQSGCKLYSPEELPFWLDLEFAPFGTLGFLATLDDGQDSGHVLGDTGDSVSANKCWWSNATA